MATIKEFFRDRYSDHGMGRVWNWTEEKIVDPQEDLSSSDDDEEININVNPYAPGANKWPNNKPKVENSTMREVDNEGTSVDDGGHASDEGDEGGSGGDVGGGPAAAGGVPDPVAGGNAAEKRSTSTKKKKGSDLAPLTPLEKELQDQNKELQDELSRVKRALAATQSPAVAVASHGVYERGESQSQDWTPRSTATSTGGSPSGRHPQRRRVYVAPNLPVQFSTLPAQFTAPSILPPISGQQGRGQRIDNSGSVGANYNYPPSHTTYNNPHTPQRGSLGDVSVVDGQHPPSNQQSTRIHPIDFDSPPASRK